MWERLDRCFANFNWFRNHDEAHLINLPFTHSDHGAMILNTKKGKLFHKRPYHFEAMWMTHPDCENVVRQTWDVEVP